MVEQIAPELVQRMVAEFRSLSTVNLSDLDRYFAKNVVETAKAIVADLPKPVDPDILEAREVACQNWFANCEHQLVRAGDYDDQAVLAGIRHGLRRGRELALARTDQEPAHG